jgi:hypothetical protein
MPSMITTKQDRLRCQTVVLARIRDVSQQVDFAGTIFTDASRSEMTTSYRSLLLTPVDLIIKRAGRKRIPIKVTGTPRGASIGLDKGRVLKRDSQ